MGIMDNEGHDPQGLGNVLRRTDAADLADLKRENERLRGVLKTIMLDCASASKDANYCPAAQRAFQSTSNFARAYT